MGRSAYILQKNVYDIDRGCQTQLPKMHI